MARLNISMPKGVYAALGKWRGKLNLSEICTRALQDEIAALEASRDVQGLIKNLRAAAPMEQELAARFGLREAVVVRVGAEEESLRERLGQAAAQYVDQRLSHGVRLAIGGGRQMWCVTKNVAPRRLRVAISALGVGEADPTLLHVHPNTLVTIWWLLLSPYATGHLVGDGQFLDGWNLTEPNQGELSQIVVASCAPWEQGAPIERLMREAYPGLSLSQVKGDFAYILFRDQGDAVELPANGRASVLPLAAVRSLVGRNDSRVVLVAGGEEKLETIKRTLQARLTNVIVTDSSTAESLLGGGS